MSHRKVNNSQTGASPESTPRKPDTLQLRHDRLRALEFITLTTCFAFALLLTRQQGFASDTSNFLAWALRLVDKPWSAFYEPGYFTTCFPVMLYLLTVVGKAVTSLSLVDSPWLLTAIKLPSVLALTGLATLVRRCSHLWNETPSLSRAMLFFGMLTWAINPGLLHDAAVFGQVDVIFVLLGVLSIHCLLARRYFLAAVFVGLSCALTPLGLAPFGLALLLTWNRRSDVGLAQAAALVTVIVGVICVTLWPFGRAHFAEAVSYYVQQFSPDPSVSMNALNFWAAIGWNWGELNSAAPFGLTKGLFAYLILIAMLAGMLVAMFAACKVRVRKLTDEQAILMGLLLTFVFYLFAPGMHERYFVALMPFFACLFLRSRQLLAAFILVSLVLAIDQMAAIDASYGAKRAILGISPLPLGSFIAKLGAMLLVFSRLRILASAKSDENAGVASGAMAPFDDLAVSGLPALCVHLRASMQKPFIFCRRDLAFGFGLLAIAVTTVFFRLGNLAVPAKPLTTTGTWRINLPEDGRPIRLYVFDGQGNGRIQISCQPISPALTADRQPGEALSSDKTDGMSLELTSFYDWRPLPVGCTQVVYLHTQLEQSAEVNEVFFQDANLKTVVPTEICDLQSGQCVPPAAHPLFDEPEFTQSTPGYEAMTFFDEIYYVRAAKELRKGEPLFENTHPPFGKVLMALAMTIFGDGPFGWRFSNALLGGLTPLIMFLFARVLFARRRYAYAAGALGLFDTFRISMSRIATIDVPSSFFLLCAYAAAFTYFTKRFRNDNSLHLRWALIAGALWGVAMATKWTAVYAAPAFALCIVIDLIAFSTQRAADGSLKLFERTAPRGPDATCRVGGVRRRRLWPQLAVYATSFGLLPVALYAASYIPLMATGSMSFSLKQLLSMQADMYRYHSSIIGEHPYSSRFYEWPIMQQPLLMFQASGLPDDMRSVLVAIGNPAIWWVIPPAIFLALYRSDLRRNVGIQYTLLCFMTQLLPWLLVKRSTFIYHFLPSSLLGMILIAFLAAQILPRYRFVVAVYGAAVVLGAVIFSPLVLGFEVSNEWVENLKWFSSWSF